MSVPSNDIPRTIRFYDRDVPGLEAGDYSIAVTQSVSSTDANTPFAKTFAAKRNFSVIAPRFALPPAGVQTVFPPGDASGIFDQNLPHVVLTEPLLPWERLITDGDVSAKGTPWMALLLFTEGDPDLTVILPPPQTPSATLAGSYAIAADPNDAKKLVLSPADTATLGPVLKPEIGDATSCYAIDISTDTFTALTPRLAELPFLAHARDVEPVMPLKVTEIASQDGFFSVVIGNRFPKAPPQGSLTGIKHIAHLVSLEGFAPYLVEAPAWPPGITRVRLVSLLSWTFTTMPEIGNFRDLMLNLTAGQTAHGDGLRLRLNPAPSTAPAPAPGSPGALVQQALGQGFTALEYDTRAGDQTFAWYHGPFVPHPVAPFAANTPFESAAAATIYDETTGTFDLSYAAGWELGRLLALSDGAFVADKLKSQRSLRNAVNLVRERTRWSHSGRQLMATDAVENAAHLHALAEPSQPRRAFASWLAETLPALLPKPGKTAVAQREPEVLAAAAAPRLSAPASLQTLYARADIRSFVSSRALADIDGGGHASGVVNTMQSLRLLENVPFAHLVPDARMLPPESIRFFYVDSNYLDALCDGASTVGIQSGRDAQQQAVVRGVVRDVAIARAHAARAARIGRPQLLAGAQPGDPVAGFLLRSSVVSGWPGLEVKAFSDLAGANQIQPVRMDRSLAPDVMLCLYPQVPVRIEFDEPKEGLAFGVEDDALVYLRYIDDAGGNPTGKVIPGKTVTLDTSYQRGATRVVDIATWQAYLAQQFGASPTPWGPAAFAIQMVRAPEQMLFEYHDG